MLANATLSYETDFNSPNEDFLGAQFTIETAVGFADGSLNSPHPYEEAGSGGTINYVSQLKIPIIIDAENPSMKFDEVVLVEPGAAGVNFPNQDFFDYVIVEGSSNKGASWIRFLDGYDSRAENAWLGRFNSGLGEDGTSTSTGSASLYIERSIDLLENTQFQANDTIVIRFRLYSDPFAVAWGWTIDNLKIQGEPDEVVAISDYLDSENSFDIYPNPSSTGLFNVKASFSRVVPGIRIDVMDMMGRIVRSEDLSSPEQTLSYQLDLSDQPTGVYLVNTIIGTDRLTTRIIKSN